MEEQQQNKDYGAEGVIWHAYSPRLMKKIIELFPIDTPVVDLGCGLNNYVSILSYLGYNAHGYDFTNLGSRNFTLSDLTFPLWPEHSQVTNVISLEVAEHIEYEKSFAYLDNVCKFKGDVILSWAVPGQEGVGHINCQSNEWVIAEMHKRGYTIDEDKTAELRLAVQECHTTWFKNTLMYFTPA